MGECGMGSHTDFTGRADGPPREWSKYLTTDHAQMRFGLDDRPITEPLARRAVEDGETEPNKAVDDGTGWRFRLSLDGCDIVVAAVEERFAHRQSDDHDAVILTAFVDVCDATDAFASDVWEFDDVHRAAALQYLGGDRSLPSDFRPQNVHVDGVILIRGHCAVFTHGHDAAVCSKCGVVATDKDTFRRERCE